MADFMVSLASMEHVKRFVDIACGCPCEVDVRAGRYVVNAKSVLGLFSLDLSQPVEVEVLGTPAQKEAFRESVKEFAAGQNG